MPVTAPSHATMMTGLYPIVHGVIRNGLTLADHHTTLAESLKAADYRTDAVVSSFVLDERFGLKQGFDTYDDKFPIADATISLRSFKGCELSPQSGFDQRANRTTDKAIAVLERRVLQGVPFFLFVHYMDPHRPYVPPERYRAAFAPIDDADLLDQEIGKYDAEVAFMDDELGRLLDSLERLGVNERSLVIFTSDHGEGLMSHGLLGHGFTLYENEVNVPLIICLPNAFQAGRVIRAPVHLVDLMPTILDIAGVADLPPHNGLSLRAAMTGDVVLRGDRAIHLHRRDYRGRPNEEYGDYLQFLRYRKPGQRFRMKGSKYAIRLGAYKFIQGGEDGTDELYDLSQDRGEQHNAASDYPKLVESMNAAIASWLRETTSPQTEPQPELSEDVVEALRALGYLP